MTKARIIFVLYVLFSIANCNAQTFNINSLIGTKWKHIKDYKIDRETIIEFTDKEMIETLTFLDLKKRIVLSDHTICRKQFQLHSTKTLWAKQQLEHIW